LRNRFFLFACGAISMTSWYSVMVLGVWKQANFKYTYGEIFGTYALLCLGAVISSPVLGRVVIVIAEKISPRAVQDAKDARPIWGPEGDASDGGACFSLLRKELCRANRQSETMTVLSFSFNTINEIREAFGNIAAEQSEKEVTELLYNQLRDHDHLAYLGSGQYLLILPVTDTSSAGQVVTRLGRAAGQYRFKVQDYNHFGEAEPLAIHFEIRSVTSSPQAELKAEDLLQVLAAQPVRLSSFIRDYEASTQPVALTLVA
jgi:GGDEF domain-containing protein